MHLPSDIIYIIAGHSQPSTQAALSRCCREFHSICDQLLYRQNVARHGSSVVFRIIDSDSEPVATLAALRKAHTAGADLNYCQYVRVRDIPAHGGVQYISCPLRTDTLVEVGPLHLAAARGREDIVHFLTDHGAAVDRTTKSCPWTPCFLAVYFDCLSTAELLLAKGAQPRSDQLGFSVLHIAAAAGSSDMTAFLLRSGVFAVDEEDVEGNTALVYALSSTRLPYGTQLAGANRYTSGLWGSVLLSVAGTSDERIGVMLTSISPTVKQRQDVALILLAAGADANREVPLTRSWSAPILFKLCWTNNIWGARFLLEQGLAGPQPAFDPVCTRRLQQEGSSPQVMELLHEFGCTGRG
ncbi:ankyrin repeat-containing domain protein [Plectosphaerella cucumerina]|uniref:Ankyrin repeat-containing domain protein n=1 Tax=Plectosphaerella cucumerina TaxID=40658 RepID=A0A8K0X9Q4_9PEZI|nr:ankyrin repeat-containing domain protein [Plectosphaerella cucumerina]